MKMIRHLRKGLRGDSQSGQTLIETITAVFILTMALSSGLAVAIYATTNSAQSKDQVIAANLAREGLEVVRMFRDSNWLAAQDDPSVDDLYTTGGGCTYGSGAANRHPCYPEAFNAPYDLESSNNANDYRPFFDTTSPTGWRLDTINGNENYMLCLQPNGIYMYDSPGGSGVLCDDPELAKYARRVTITTGNTSSPYTGNVSNPTATGASAPWGGHSPEKVVTSVVIWQGRNCTPFPTNPSSLDPVTFATRCKVVMTERLTNWKDYQ